MDAYLFDSRTNDLWDHLNSYNVIKEGVLKKLINDGADVEKEQELSKSTRTCNAIHMCIRRLRYDFQSFLDLLEYGHPNLEKCNESGNTVLLACLKSFMFQSRDEESQIECITALIKSNADVNAQNTYTGENSLFYCVPTLAKSSPRLFQILLESGVDVNQQNNAGQTLLFCICERAGIVTHGLKFVKSLLEHNADPNIVDKNMISPLIVASASHFPFLGGHFWGENREVIILKMLIENKADLNHSDKYKTTALMAAILSNQTEEFIKKLTDQLNIL